MDAVKAVRWRTLALGAVVILGCTGGIGGGAAAPAGAGAEASPSTSPAAAFATSADGVQIAYTVRGQGEPTLVFVHGWLGNQSNWDAQTEFFAQNHRVVTLDLAGFGLSGSDREAWSMEAFGEDIAAVMDAAGVHDAILVGHSMGSATVVEAARLRGDAVRDVVVVDVFQDVEETLTPEQVEQRAAGALPYIDEFIAEDPSRVGAEVWLVEDLHQYFTWKSNRLADILETLPQKVTAINSDRIPTDLAAARRHQPNYDVKIVEGVGHGVMIEAPDRFNELLSEVIAASRPAGT